MNKKVILRLISLFMLLAAVVFVIYALHHPEGGYDISIKATYVIYACYLAAMVLAFILSFFVKSGRNKD